MQVLVHLKNSPTNTSRSLLAFRPIAIQVGEKPYSLSFSTDYHHFYAKIFSPRQKIGNMYVSLYL